ncbi:hypothetical protein [Acidiferrobacter sp.]|uniref:hypothetical protein n=1 Tax=Acidiferrobacter sp. TaxID=1872107 RepID=UPI0026240373|nr:hypothetical protein [Acidiferrobacter sp.]
MAETFPEHVRFVLEALREVYRIPTRAPAKRALTPEQRLLRHQAENTPRMMARERWMQAPFGEQAIESKSALGAAIRTM